MELGKGLSTFHKTESGFPKQVLLLGAQMVIRIGSTFQLRSLDTIGQLFFVQDRNGRIGQFDNQVRRIVIGRCGEVRRGVDTFGVVVVGG